MCEFVEKKQLQIANNETEHSKYNIRSIKNIGQPIIQLTNIDYVYPDGTHALKSINLTICEGEKIVFLGSNGAGKSTLFLILNGLLKPLRGEFFYKNKRVGYSRSSLMELRKNVGIVFQDPETQILSSNVFEEVSFGPMNLKLHEDIVRQRVEDSLKKVCMFEHRKKPVHFLSYGQKKRVSIAGVLAMKPEVIIFDEPMSCLDPVNANNMIELFNELNDKGKTILISTHDIDFAYSWADKVVVMKDGEVIKQGGTQDVFKDRALLVFADLGVPLILEVYFALCEKGIIKHYTPIPRSIQELLALLSTRDI